MLRPRTEISIGRLVAFAAACVVLSTASPASAIIFDFVNDDSPGEGFNDPTLGASRQTAVQYALNIWGNYLASSYVGETITVHASFDPLGGSLFGAPGAQAFSPFVATDGNFIFTGTVANHLVPGGSFASASVIVAQFNSDVDNPTVLGSTSWYYGTDGNAGTDVDLVTVTLHEVMHGLGFTSQFDDTTGNYAAINFGGSLGVLNLPSFFEGNVGIGPSGSTMFTDLTDSQRITEAVGGNLYWTGANGVAANGGVRPQLYSPSTYNQGSSIIHLDETVFSTDLISPSLSVGEVHHAPSLVDLGMLQDLGWDIQAVPEPSSFALTGLIVAATGYYRRRKNSNASDRGSKVVSI